MNKAIAIAALVLGLWGLAMFVTSVQLHRVRIENSATDTVDAVRNSQRGNYGGGMSSSYRDWPK